MTISPAARRVAALERLLAPEPSVPPKATRELEAILERTTDDELDEFEAIYRTAADAGFEEPQGADRERALEIMRAAHERRRQPGEPPA